jgi:heme oxygenase (mycobilin-producing)
MANVVLINPFERPPAADDSFLASWPAVAEYLRDQPGFAGSRLHRAMSSNARFRFVNVAEWASPSDFQRAVTSEEFRRLAGGMPAGLPSLFELVRTL